MQPEAFTFGTATHVTLPMLPCTAPSIALRDEKQARDGKHTDMTDLWEVPTEDTPSASPATRDPNGTPPKPTPLPVKPDGIPAAMKSERRWVAWNYEWRAGKNGTPGKWTKPPVMATATQRKADVTDRSCWRSDEDALGAYEDGKCDGVGFVLGDGWVGFDADHTDALHIVRQLNSYTEKSPSGDGVHVIMRGTKPSDERCRTKQFELYDVGRYFTVTGHHVASMPATVEERSKEIAAVYAQLFAPDEQKPEPKPAPVPAHGNGLTDDEVIAKAKASQKSGTRFTQLWNGDASLWTGDKKPYPSQSEADAALCAMLAFWTAKDAAQIDRLFRQSKLFREKWDERRGAQTYGELTIANAIAKAEKVYAPQTPRIASSVELLRATEVPIVKLNWLWHARIARKAITLWEGGPDMGKSTVLVDIAARVTRGHSMPGETTTRQPANVVMLIAEDDLGATVVPRLLAAGADLDRVFFLTAARDEHGRLVPFHMSDDCEKLRAQCEQTGDVALIIVDPLVSFIGSRSGKTVNTNNDMEVRKALGPLKDMAEALNVAVTAIRHHRKGVSLNAMEAGGGSVAFAALVRVVVAALPHPDDDTKYMLAVAKNNLVKKSERPALEYEIVPSEYDSDIGRIAWGATVDMSADEILAATLEAKKQNTGKVGEARDFLERLLADGQWKPTKEIIAAGDANGFNKSSVERAKERLPIKVERRGEKWGWLLAAEPEM
jgi:hypothetical protein